MAQPERTPGLLDDFLARISDVHRAEAQAMARELADAMAGKSSAERRAQVEAARLDAELSLASDRGVALKAERDAFSVQARCR